MPDDFQFDEEALTQYDIRNAQYRTMAEKVFLNDKLVDIDKACISVTDSGFLYGAGLFETMRSCNGVVFALADHLDRLFFSAGALSIESVFDRDYITGAVYEVLRANELTEHKDPQYLHTLARLHYERGDLEGAVKWSRKAVKNLTGQPFFVGPPIRAALEEYEAQFNVSKKATSPSTNE